jgi:hypothetical protein
LPVLAALILSLVTIIVIGFLLRESKPSSKEILVSKYFEDVILQSSLLVRTKEYHPYQKRWVSYSHFFLQPI